MDWLLDLVIGTVADPVMGAVYHGSIKYVNKELPFSSRLRGQTSPVSNGKIPRTRDGDQGRACSLTVPESLVSGFIQIKTAIETCPEFSWRVRWAREGVATPASGYSLKIPPFFPF